MKEFTQIENLRVEIRRRSYQRSMNLSVKPDGSVKITCGKRMSQREIERFIGESQMFIQKRRLEIESLRQRHPDKKLISGERFLFFGERWPLEIVWTWGSRVKIQATEGYLEMLAPLQSSHAERHKALKMFYRRQARLHLRERLDYFAGKMSLFPSRVSIRGQKTRWGSCSSGAAISLNWKLLAVPLEVIDYVIIHELAHIRHLNHSRQFWDLVAEVQPQWRNSRRWLKEHEFEIGVQFQGEAEAAP